MVKENKYKFGRKIFRGLFRLDAFQKIIRGIIKKECALKFDKIVIEFSTSYENSS